MSIERYLVEHCSSTLASIKTANLFTVDYDSEQELTEHLCQLNEMLNEKGVYVTALRTNGKKAWIYVYRRSRLEKELHRKDICDFLGCMGYRGAENQDIDGALNTLRLHLAGESFPHEIGVFLGYPLADVIGFIENRGRNCKAIGCWKVYCDEQEAENMFCKFKKCKAVYVDLWNQGCSVSQLTVAR